MGLLTSSKNNLLIVISAHYRRPFKPDTTIKWLCDFVFHFDNQVCGLLKPSDWRQKEHLLWLYLCPHKFYTDICFFGSHIFIDPRESVVSVVKEYWSPIDDPCPNGEFPGTLTPYLCFTLYATQPLLVSLCSKFVFL